MFEAVQRTIRTYKLLNKGDQIIVGVSGGPDSVALLHVLWRLRDGHDLCLHVAHLNHQIRGNEADKDALFVRNLAHQWEIAYTEKSVDVPRLSRESGLTVEEAGRQARYDFFEKLAVETNSHKIAVAHHSDDQAETVLINLLRGSGTEGIAGMRTIRDNKLIRPLLFITRQEIEAYCQEHNLESRLDQSNLETEYHRNRIRLELIPNLERDYNPQIRQALSRTATILGDESDCLKSLTEEILSLHVRVDEHECFMPIQPILDQPRAIQRRIIRSMIRLFRGSLRDISFENIEDVLALVERGKVSKRRALPDNLEAALTYDGVVLRRTPIKMEVFSESKELVVPGITEIPGLKYRFHSEYTDNPSADFNQYSSRIYLDIEKVAAPLYVRSRKNGDRIMLPSGEGTSKVKKIMIDQKINPAERQKIPILTDAQDRILWIVGVRKSGHCRPGPTGNHYIIIDAELIMQGGS